MKKIKVADLINQSILSTMGTLRTQKMSGLKAIQFAYFLKEFDKKVNPIMQECNLLNTKYREEHAAYIKQMRSDHLDITDEMKDDEIFAKYPEIKEQLEKMQAKFLEKQTHIVDKEIDLPELSLETIEGLEFTAQQFAGLEATVLK